MTEFASLATTHAATAAATLAADILTWAFVALCVFVGRSEA
jgi:hypothetical protein